MIRNDGGGGLNDTNWVNMPTTTTTPLHQIPAFVHTMQVEYADKWFSVQVVGQDHNQSFTPAWYSDRATSLESSFQKIWRHKNGLVFEHLWD
jgi:hypothetical protein